MIETLHISAKCSDLCFVQAKNEAGEVVAESDGYVPGFMPGEHYGDYVSLQIDVKTGQILNWEKPTQKQIKEDLKNV